MSHPAFSNLTHLIHQNELGNLVQQMIYKQHLFVADNICGDVTSVARHIASEIGATRFTYANRPDGLMVILGETGYAPPNAWIESELAQELSEHDDFIRVVFYSPENPIHDQLVSRVLEIYPEIQFTGFVVFLIPLNDSPPN